MAEITAKFDFKPFEKWLDERERRMKRVAMYTVRAGGRVVAKEAKRQTPVLKDKTQASYTQIRRGAKFRAGGGVGPIQGEGAFISNRPIPGLLRASIKPSRRLRETGGVYSLKVGPRGQRVHLYAGKIEARAHFMEAGYRAVEAEMGRIMQAAADKVWRG